MGLLDALIYGIRDVLNSSHVPFVRKSRIELGANLTGTVDDAHDCIRIDAPGGGGGGSPGGATGEAQVNGGASDFAGSVPGSPSKPSTGVWRFPYNSGSPFVFVAAKDSTDTDRNFIVYGAGDGWTIGNSSQDLTLRGLNNAGLDLAGGIAGLSSPAFISLSAGSYIAMTGGQRVTLAEQHAPYTLANSDFHISAIDSGGTYKLRASPANGESVEISNTSGGAITVDGNGDTIYGIGATDTLVDGETAVYRYNSGSVSSSPNWIRVS